MDEYKANKPMPSASTVRLQIEAKLAQKIPSALTPRQKMIRPVEATGIVALDELLQGGLPIGAVSELVGPECSGRTSVALSFVASMTQVGKVCAWLDVSNALDPVSAAAAGVDLSRLLWVRCGAQQQCIQRPTGRFSLPEKYLISIPAKQGLHGGGFGPHPRTETKGLSQAVSDLLRPEVIAPCCSEPRRRERSQPGGLEQWTSRNTFPPSRSVTPWSRMEQAMRATDLLLQGGGFSAIVLDLGSIAPEFASRVPLATWHRYRAATERTQSSIVLLTQYACAKSSAELLLRFEPGGALCGEATVLTGMEYGVEVVRQRFTQPEKVIPLRKPPQRANAASWSSRTAWAGCR
jgi:recombination protein RecA